MSHGELERLVGEKVAATVLFYVFGERLFFRMGDRWYEGQPDRDFSSG